MSESRSWQTRLLGVVGFAFLNFGVALGASLYSRSLLGVAYFWPANGMLLGVLLCTATRLWPVFIGVGAAGSLAAFVLGGETTDAACALVLVNASVIWLLAWRGRNIRQAAPRVGIDSCYPRLMGFGVGLAPAGAGCVAAFLVSRLGDMPFAGLVVPYCFANALGIGLATPLVLCALRPGAGKRFAEARLWQQILLPVGFGVSTLGVFLQTRYPLLFLVTPALVAMAAAFGVFWLELAMPLVACTALATTHAGLGPFSINQSVPAGERAMLAEGFVVASLFMGYFSAAFLSARRQLIADLTSERDRGAQRERVLLSEASYRLIAENDLDMVARIGLDGHWRSISASSAAILGRKAESLVGHDPIEFVHPEDTQAKEAMQARLLGGESDRGEIVFRIVNPDRGIVWVEDRAHAVCDPVTGRRDGYVAIWRDVTARCRLEEERLSYGRELAASNAQLERLARHLSRARDQAEQASQAKTRFLASISHELRTPLNGILGYTELLRLDDGLTEQQRSRLEAMHDAGRHLLGMINRVLDLSEIEASAAQLQLTEVNLRNLMADCVKLVHPVAAAKHLALSMNIAPDAPDLAAVDSMRLRQVLLNLLGNAIKFTQLGGVELRLSRGETGKVLRIEVADTGPGVDEKKQHRLFQKFDRLDVETVNAVEGAGLGLALSSQLALMMGGRLGYLPNPTGGSIFWLELPIIGTAATEGAAPAPQEDAKPEPVQRRPALRVLVVDDVGMNREVAYGFLRNAGHEVVCADGGAEAVEAVAASDFDVVLMDVSMPEVSGFEATRRIRALPGQAARVPIIAMTAQVFSEQVKACREAGMDAHVPKPFTQRELLSAVADVFDAAHGRARTARPDKVDEQNAIEAVAPHQDASGELPIFDQEMLDRTAGFVSAPALRDHLRTLAARCEQLLRGLRASDLVGGSLAGAAQAAHEIAGSAGMFGFVRLTDIARRFEHAALLGQARAQIPTEDLIFVLEASVLEMQRQSHVIALAGADKTVAMSDERQFLSS